MNGKVRSPEASTGAAGERGQALGKASRIRRVFSTLGTARRRRLLRVLRELHVVGERQATVEGAREFRHGLEELGTTYVQLGQLLSSRPDRIPDEYIAELSRLGDEVTPEPYSAIENWSRSSENGGNLPIRLSISARSPFPPASSASASRER